MSYEPFRGAAPPPVTSTSPPRQNTSPSRRGQVSQSYEEFRATGKSIELTDATDTRGRTGAPPQAQYGYTVSPYSGNQPPVRSPNYRIPGKSLWAKIRLFLRVLSVLASLTTGLLVGLVLKKYMETKHQRNTEELFWPKDLKLEPTYYMIV